MAGLLNTAYASLDTPTSGNRTELARRASRLPSLISTARADTLRRPASSRLVLPPAQLRRVSSLRLLPSYWAIQVGAFRSHAAARAAAARARRVTRGGPARLERIAVRGGAVWRAQVTGFTRHTAYAACGEMARHRRPCLVLRLGPPARSARG